MYFEIEKLLKLMTNSL